MRLYGELAGWWPLLSPPEDYEHSEFDSLIPCEMFAGVNAAAGR